MLIFNHNFLDNSTLTSVGNYLLTRHLLGKGHFARVEEAIHKHLDTKVAIKIINLNALSNDYTKKHLKREEGILAQLSHPGIIKLFEIIETKNNYYLILEFGGDNLCNYIRSQRRSKLEEQVVRVYARQIVSAVSYLHKKGIVHRDIKLENILLDKLTNRIKLADFGLSCVWDKNTFLKTNCGSPEYAAPELHYGKKYGAAVDIWSL